jgi:hypothetical protein
MEENDSYTLCQQFLNTLIRTTKYTKFQESIKVLEAVACEKGLDDDTLNKIFKILTKANLNCANSIALIQCMIPQNVINDDKARNLISWFFSMSVPETTLSVLLEWLIGCWKYELINRNSMYIFYDVFFYVMLKQERLESRLAQLIYLMSKPEDVTRRQVTRLLKLKTYSKKTKTHIIALLSLFKSYKPEFVPETIPTINIQSVWRPISESLQTGFTNTRDRIFLRQNKKTDAYYNWNTNVFKNKKGQESLIPVVRNFKTNSNIFSNKNQKMVVDIINIEQLGKYDSVIRLPTNSTSLLLNNIGHHLLTFADFEYQHRFTHNLYYTFWRSFIYENGRYSSEQMNNIIDMTITFCRYMQHGISIMNYFINEYLSWGIDEYNLKLLSLMEWSSVSIPELQDYVFKHMKLMFYSSSLNIKCKIIRTLRILLLNLSIINNSIFKDKCFPFLGQSFTGKLIENVKIIEYFTRELIISGLNIHFYNSKIISEALSFYEQIDVLEIYRETSFVSLAPSALIYGSFVTKNCVLLSRVCALILQYTNDFKKHKNQSSITSSKWLKRYTTDIIGALWYNDCFNNRLKKNRYFLKFLSNSAIKSNSACDINRLMNIFQHYAVLPYMFALYLSGMKIKTEKDGNMVAALYYSYINQFILSVIEK